MNLNKQSILKFLLKLGFFVSSFGGLIKIKLSSLINLLPEVVFLISILILIPEISKTKFSRKSIIFLICIFLLNSIAVLYLFHPYVLNLSKVILGYRAYLYIYIYILLGIGLQKNFQTYEDIFFNFLPVLVCINIIFGFSQLMGLTQLGNDLIKDIPYSSEGLFSFRITGFYQGPVQFALMSSFLFFAGIISLEKEGSKKLFYIFIVLGLFGMIISFSRAVLGISIILFIIFFAKRVFFNYRFALVSLAIFFVFIIYFNDDIIEVSQIITRFEKLANPLEDNSFKDGRLYRWKIVLDNIKREPLGYGTGFTLFYDDIDKNIFSKDPFITESIYLDIFVQNGVIPGILFIILSLYMIYLSFRILWNRNDLNESAKIKFTLAATINLLFFLPAITSPNFSAFPFSYLHPIFLGIMLNKHEN